MQLHPLCSMFPRVEGSEYDELKSDIMTNGLLSPIVLHDGMILDGANRYRACLDVGVAPRFEPYSGRDPVTFVLSANLHRRHLNVSQRALIASQIANLAVGSNQYKVKIRDDVKVVGRNSTLPLSDPLEALNISKDSAKKARKIAKAVPDSVLDAVKSGDISLNLAEKVIDLPEEVKESLAELPKEQVKDAVKKATAKAKPEKKAESAHPPEDKTELIAIREFSAEQGRIISELMAENEVFHADDPLKAALAEIKRLTSLCETQQIRINSLLNSEAEAKKAAQSWKNKFDRLEKSIKRAA